MPSYKSRGKSHKGDKHPSVNDFVFQSTNAGLKLAKDYVDLNPEAKTTLLMIHGWPAIWSSWKHQIMEFKDEYHVIAVDVRGFGLSTHPGGMRSSGTFGDLVGDLKCALQHAGVHEEENVVCIGHDWGTQICYETVRMRPDLIKGVVSLVVPYVTWAGPYQPVDVFLPALPHLTYQVYFRDHPDQAAEELEKDVRRTLRAIYLDRHNPPPKSFLTSLNGFLGAYSNIKQLASNPYFDEAEEDGLVEHFTNSGFFNSLQFYQHENRYASWKQAHEQGNFTIPCPVLSILPTEDPVAHWSKLSIMLQSVKFAPNITEVMIESAHWPQLEEPQEVNRIIREWLERVF